MNWLQAQMFKFNFTQVYISMKFLNNIAYTLIFLCPEPLLILYLSMISPHYISFFIIITLSKILLYKWLEQKKGVR